MDSFKRFRKALIYGLCFLVVGCATTKLTSIWKDPSYSTMKLEKVMVVALAKEESMRRLFEDEFVRQLAAQNIQAVASYTKFTLEQAHNDKDTIKLQIQEEGFTAVIVTRLLDKKQQEVYYPATTTYAGPPGAYYNGWHNYYNTGYSTMTSPGFSTTYDIVRLESNVYDIQADKLIWSGLSESFYDNGPDTQVRGVVAVLVKGLSK
jgi:hypothetical protein